MNGKERSRLLNAMLDADRRYDSAAKALVAAVEVALPPGTRVAVTMGRARVVGVVQESGGCWWSDPATVWIENERTGKRRRFDPTYSAHQLTVIDEPPAVDAVGQR